MNTEQETQAQAEPEVVVWLLVERDGPCEFSYVQFEPTEGYEPCITLQSHREAMADVYKNTHELVGQKIELLEAIAKKDAALDACVEALEEAKTYTSSPAWSPSMTEDIEAAITQAKEARK